MPLSKLLFEGVNSMLLGSWHERFVWVHKLVGIATPTLIRTNTHKHSNFKPETMWAPRPGCGFCMPVFIRGVWTPLGGELCWRFRKTDVLEFRSWCFAWKFTKMIRCFLERTELGKMICSAKWSMRFGKTLLTKMILRQNDSPATKTNEFRHYDASF